MYLQETAAARPAHLHTPSDVSPHRARPEGAADQPLTHRVVAEELTVATVAELPIFLVGGGGGAGTTL